MSRVDKVSMTALVVSRCLSLQKSAVVAELGESTSLLPTAVTRAFRVNDRVK